jgi:hypothetical protein
MYRAARLRERVREEEEEEEKKTVDNTKNENKEPQLKLSPRRRLRVCWERDACNNAVKDKER